MNMKNKIVFYSDGGSRGNPGESALGVYFPGLEKEYSEYLHIATNNEAEYKGIIYGLKKAKRFAGEDHKKTVVEVRADSELAVKQLNGEFKLKDEKLIPLFIEIWNLKTEFKSVLFTQIPREENMRADAMVNRELDGRQKGLF